MVLKFCANLSFMFQESGSLLERYELAKKIGFKGVECASPYEYPIEEVVSVKSRNRIQQVLINTPTGNIAEGELGFAALPNKKDKFMDNFNVALEYAKALECEVIHIMSGIVPIKTPIHDEVFEYNIRHVAPLLEREAIIGVIEPINTTTVPNYYLDNFQDALKIIKKVNSPNIKLQLDIYHLQRISGNLTKNIMDLMPYVGHIQIAQVPNRNEPGTPGEIDYSYIFGLIESQNYDGWIGLEYKPLTTTTDGLLNWLTKYGYSL